MKTKGVDSFKMDVKECGKIVNLRFEAEVDIPIYNLMVIFYETELYPYWFPYVTESIIVGYNNNSLL